MEGGGTVVDMGSMRIEGESEAGGSWTVSRHDVERRRPRVAREQWDLRFVDDTR